MHLTSLITIIYLVSASFAAPGDRSSYTVSGLSTRKQAILSANSNTLNLAITILKDKYISTKYKYGE